MTSQEILDMIGEARGSYVWQTQLLRSGQRQKHPRRPKLLLVAALIGAMLLLAGCVAVFLRLQDLSIGKATYTQRFDQQGHYIEPTEKTADVLVFFEEGPVKQAMEEWYAWLETCPEDGKVLPGAYGSTYRCRNQAMADKVTEIGEKYGLKLLGEQIWFQRWQQEPVMARLGIESLLRPGAEAELGPGAGWLELPMNFSMECGMTLTGEDALWTENIYVEYSYTRKDYLPGYGFEVRDLAEFQQWDHRAPDGTRLLLALDRKGWGYIIAQQAEGVIGITVEGNRTISNFPDPEDVLSREALEQIADAFDYAVQPQAVDLTALQPELDAADAAAQERLRSIEPMTYDSFDSYLLERVTWYPDWQYCFWDLDGDGVEELLWGQPGQGFSRYAVLHEGRVWEAMPSGTVFHLLESGGLLIRENPNRGENPSYSYLPPTPNGAVMAFDFGGSLLGVRFPESELTLVYKWGGWRKGDAANPRSVPVTEAEVQAAIAQRPEKQLPWKPLREYRMADGRTLGQILDLLDVPLSRAHLEKAYGATALEADSFGRVPTHFALRDLNGDGVEDLLLSLDGKTVYTVKTYRFDRLMKVCGGFTYLCQGNVMEEVTPGIYEGADLVHRTFRRMTELAVTEQLAELTYNKASESWMDYETLEPVPREQAEAVLARYPRVELELRPVEELGK